MNNKEPEIVFRLDQMVITAPKFDFHQYLDELSRKLDNFLKWYRPDPYNSLLEDGWRQDYNPNFLPWRVRNGPDGIEIHPDDLQEFYKQQQLNQSVADDVFAIFGMGIGGFRLKPLSQGASKAVKTAEQLTHESVTVKLERYLLNAEHVDGASKAKWFEKALGFTKENAGDLAKQIVFDPNKAVKTATTEFGTKYNQVIPITGPNGKTIDVVFAWIENNDGVVRLITAIPTKL